MLNLHLFFGLESCVDAFRNNTWTYDEQIHYYTSINISLVLWFTQIHIYIILLPIPTNLEVQINLYL